MKRFGASLALVLGFTCFTGSAPAQSTPDKRTIVDRLVPEKIKALAENASAIVGVYSGVTNAVQTISAFAEALGIIHPSSGPDFEQLFGEVHEHLDDIAGALDWNISATARADRFGKMMSAYHSVMLPTMFGVELSNLIKANAEQSSTEAIFAVEHPDLAAFKRVYRSSVTSGPWTSFVSRRPTVTGGRVYDWRLGIPELLQFIGLRLQVMAAVDPDFRWNGHYRAEFLQHRNFLNAQYRTMTQGVACQIAAQNNECGPIPQEGCFENATFTHSCADIYTGLFAQTVTGFLNFEYNPSGRVARTVMRKMPIFEMRSMMDMLYALATPESESLTTPGSISIWTPASGSLCLDVQWNGNSNGTPVWLWNCTLNEAQTWQYDRQTGEIFHPASGKCLDVQNASLTAGTRLQIWSCNGTDAQRWTWDPETRVVQNALGTVLDVENRNVAKRSLTVAWERTQTASQQWWFPDVWDALARCFANGTCG